MKENISVVPTADLRHRKQYADAGVIVAKIVNSEVRGLNLDETINLFSSLLMIIKDIDDYLDILSNEKGRKLYAQEILSVLFSENDKNFKNTEFDVVMNHISKLDNKKKNRLKTYGKLLFSATEKVKKAKNPEEYSKFVSVEGALTMEFLLSILFLQDQQECEIKIFEKWIKRAAAAGNLFDSLIDLNSDKKNGLFKELPNFRTQLVLLKYTIIYLVKVFPRVPKRFIYKAVMGHLKAIFIKR
jgi:hypothetical protein